MLQRVHPVAGGEDGGDRLTVHGIDFGPLDDGNSFKVYIGGKECTDVEREDASADVRATCVAPPNTGFCHSVMLEAAGVRSSLLDMFSYKPADWTLAGDVPESLDLSNLDGAFDGSKNSVVVLCDGATPLQQQPVLDTRARA